MGIRILEKLRLGRKRAPQLRRDVLAPARLDLPSRPWMNAELPPNVLSIPTMLSVRERQLLYWLACDYFTGVGRIVDGGSFLGGSTAALASGLAARADGPWEKTIVSYDLFRVEEYTLAHYGKHFPDRTIGASFRPVYDAHVAPWKQHIKVREGDACRIGWSGEPIELLFLDMVKLWQLNDVVLEQFFPCLIPGRSVIIQQDYLWGACPWIHITMELMAGSVEILDSMPNGSVVYLLTGPVPAELIGMKLRETLSPKRQGELMDCAVERWQGEERGLVELARVMLIAEQNVADAHQEYANVCARYAGVQRVEHCASYVHQYLPKEPCTSQRDVSPKIWAA
jgi:hypothetical protein